MSSLHGNTVHGDHIKGLRSMQRNAGKWLSVLPEQDTGVLSQKSEQKSAQEQMMTNPDMMSGMMKQNLFGIIPQVGFQCWRAPSSPAACSPSHTL